ncbi:MerR family transcriptional regulator [Endozoicomonas ascidiicola]|uniref:MerR family transcriptional regulator n=1 Tax=Endozoicomonas ascidiicola TaxID=1698521 RepID=UPI0012F99CCD|nr:MerR family transcriptional regulator [Endozoicomonas ascidiicola]
MDIEDLPIKGNLPNEVICPPNAFAKSIGVSEHVVRHWMKQGILPVFRIGRRVFINMLKLREQVEQGQNNIPL